MKKQRIIKSLIFLLIYVYIFVFIMRYLDELAEVKGLWGLLFVFLGMYPFLSDKPNELIKKVLDFVVSDEEYFYIEEMKKLKNGGPYYPQRVFYRDEKLKKFKGWL